MENMGSWLIHDENDKWAMMPIVSKYINYDGFTDFKDGLIPDYIINDNVFNAVPSVTRVTPHDKAIELATGKSAIRQEEKPHRQKCTGS